MTAPPAPRASAAANAPADAAGRAAWLEELLGDPADPANPHGHRPLLEADERRATPEATEQLLTDAGLTAEFVPRALGGRLGRPDTLARVLRPVFRRDVALGFGYGLTALFGASAVWAAGDAEQQGRTARHLLAGGGGRVTHLHHELTHANAILRDEFTARRARDGFRVEGRKDVIINAERAGLLVMYARTGTGPGPRNHSVLLLDRERLPAGAVRPLPRVPVPGMRGNSFAGLEFTDCHVPGDALVGDPGDGVPLALRTFMVNRCLIPATLVAGADSALRLAVRAATTGRRGGQPARRHHTVLAGVFADLLACDSMAVTGLRALSLVPDSAHLAAAAVKLTTQDVLRENLEELATVLGAHGYDHGSRYGGFRKLGRDLPVAGLGHAGRAACQAVLVPRLRSLARTSWFAAPEPPAQLFRLFAPLPDLDYRKLSLSGGDDLLHAALVAAAGRLAPRRSTGPLWAALADLAAAFVQEARALRVRCGALPASVRDTLADPRACALVDRYVLVAGAAACLGAWEGQDGRDTFLAQPAWPVLALSRILRRLGVAGPELPDGVTRSVLAELLTRFAGNRSFDLYDMHLAG
ncbi:acyl-CoA dehydrogenase [Streptomyces sp. NPDC050264]|uniref:acyl-CoA dehydrogenase n=1 Tax=Streptomyces sp. NPDC050264 TaxID=3155038 RepID=UPI00344579D0